MSETDKHSRTEQPTAKKLTDARKKNPPRSQELSTATMLLASVAGVSWVAATARERLGGFMSSTLGSLSARELTAGAVHELLVAAAQVGGHVLLPPLAAIVICVIAANVAQGGVMLNFERLEPDASKLNPLAGIHKILPKPESLAGVFKAVLKLFFISLFVWRVIAAEFDSIMLLIAGDLPSIGAFMVRVSFKMLWNVILAMVVLAVADLLWVRWSFMRALRMTKQEVKNEARDSEGDPQVKGQLRKRMMQLMAKRLAKVVPQATVIITNPTHFAVALRYDRETMAAPVVVAKGVDAVALKIREIAREHGVPIVENRPLARDLYASVRERHPVPERLWSAVADVLAFVYRLRGGAA